MFTNTSTDKAWPSTTSRSKVLVLERVIAYIPDGVLSLPEIPKALAQRVGCPTWPMSEQPAAP